MSLLRDTKYRYHRIPWWLTLNHQPNWKLTFPKYFCHPCSPRRSLTSLLHSILQAAAVISHPNTCCLQRCPSQSWCWPPHGAEQQWQAWTPVRNTPSKSSCSTGPQRNCSPSGDSPVRNTREQSREGGRGLYALIDFTITGELEKTELQWMMAVKCRMNYVRQWWSMLKVHHGFHRLTSWCGNWSHILTIYLEHLLQVIRLFFLQFRV